MEIQKCFECKQPIVDTDGQDYYMGPPYWWGRGDTAYCLACWLGVGPHDLSGVGAAS